jgi:glucose-1-phosphate adenylyltransferase
MDLLGEKPSINLNDRSWIIHTRTEERSPVNISKGAVIADSMITDGCVIYSDTTIERSILSPGVVVKPGAQIRDTIILTDSVIESGAIVERAIIDKRVRIDENARVGSISSNNGQKISMVGKNSHVPPNFMVEAGGIIATDVIPLDYPSDIIRSNDYIQTKRLAHEV